MRITYLGRVADTDRAPRGAECRSVRGPVWKQPQRPLLKCSRVRPLGAARQPTARSGPTDASSVGSRRHTGLSAVHRLISNGRRTFRSSRCTSLSASVRWKAHVCQAREYTGASDHSATGDYKPSKTPQAHPSQSARSNPWPAAGRTERRLKASSARRKGYTNAHRGRRRDRRHACRRCAPGSCLPDCCTAPTACGRRQ